MAGEYDRKNLNEVLGLDNDRSDFGGEMVDLRKRGSIFGRIRFGLYGVLSLLSKRHGKVSMLALLVSQIVNLMQLLMFTFNVKKGFPWSSWVTSSILPIIEAGSFSVSAFKSETVTSVGFILAIILLAITLGTTAWIAYSFASSSGVTTLWMLQPLRLALGLLTSVLYVPVLGLLLQVFDCESQLSAILECSGPMYYGVSAFACLLFVLFVVFTSMSVLVNFPREPHSSNHAAKTHGRIDCLSLWLRAFLSIIFALSNSDQSLMLACVLVGVSATMTASPFYFLPFYKMEMNKIVICSHGIFLLSTVCLVLEMTVYDMDTRGRFGSFIAFVTAAPMVWFVTDALVEQRCAKLEAMAQNGVDFDSPMLTEVAFRIAFGFSQDGWKAAQQHYRRQVDERFPNNGFLTIHFAMLLHECGQNFILNQQYMNRAKGLELWIDDRFFVFKHNLDAESRSTGVAGNAMNYMAFEHHSTQAQKRVLEAMDLITQIWKVIGSNKGADELLKSGARLRKASQRANQHLEELLRLTTESPAVFRLYAYFLEYVLNDKAAAKVLEEHADLLEQMGVSDDVNFDDRGNRMHAANVTISGNENSLGEITDVSMGMCTLFGMDKDEFLGKNISTLTPPPFDKIHDMFLLKYIENNTDFVTRKVKVWGRHARGYVIPLHLEVRPSVDPVSGDLIFSGVFVPDNNTQEELIMVTGGTDVAFATKGGWENIFGIHDVGDDEAPFRQRSLADLLSGKDLEQPLLQSMLSNDDRGCVALNGTSYEVESKRLVYHIYNMETKDSSEELVMVLLHVKHIQSESPLIAAAAAADAAEGSQAIISKLSKSSARNDLTSTTLSSPASHCSEGPGLGGDNWAATNQGVEAHLLPLGGIGETRLLNPPPLGAPTGAAAQPAVSIPPSAGLALHRVPSAGALDGGAIPTDTISHTDRSDAGSVASSLSGNTRSVFERVSKGMARNERLLGAHRRRSFLVAAVCLLLAVSEWMNRMSLYSLNIDAAEQMHNAVRRNFLILDTTLLLHEIMGINSHIDDEPNSEAFRVEMLGYMSDRVDALREVHVSITESESASVDAIQELNAKPTILTVVDATKPELNEEKNLWVAVHLFAAYATEYLRTEPRECDESCKFVLNNGPTSVFEACNQASKLYLEVALEAILSASWYSTRYLLATGAVAILWTILFTIPVITRMRSRHERSSNAFRRIPRKTIRYMARQATQRAREVYDKLHADADDDYDGEGEEPELGQRASGARQRRNSFDINATLAHDTAPALPDAQGAASRLVFVDEGAQPSRPGKTTGDHEQPQGQGPGPDEHEETDADSDGAGEVGTLVARPRRPVVTRRATKVTPAAKSGAKSKSRQRPSRRRKLVARLKTVGRNVGLVLRQMMPFFLTLAYMGSVWALDELDQVTRMSLARLEHSAGERWVLSQQLLLVEETRDIEVFPDWSVWHNRAADRHAWEEDVVHRLHVVHERLTLGDEALGLPPMADKSAHPTQYKIFFEDACFSHCKAQPDLEMSKLAKGGLQLAFTNFLNDMTEKDHEQLATSIAEKMELYHNMRVLEEGLEHSMEGYGEEAAEHYRAQAFFGRIILICYALVLLASSYNVYMGFRSMNRRSQDIQFLMVVLPVEVLNRTPDLRSILLENDWGAK